MSKHKKKSKLPDIWPYFNVDELTREEVLHLIQIYYPCGSGPLHTMQTICCLLINIAELKGFKPFTEEELKASPGKGFYETNHSALKERG